MCYLFSMYAQTSFNVINGTLIDVLIVNDVSSEKDSDVAVQVAHDVINGFGKVIIKAGTPVKFNIERKHRSCVGKPGKIDLNFISVDAIDGKPIMLNGKHTVEGHNRRGMALGIGLSAGLVLFFPMLAFLAKRGGRATIPQNTTVTNIPIIGNYEVK